MDAVTHLFLRAVCKSPHTRSHVEPEYRSVQRQRKRADQALDARSSNHELVTLECDICVDPFEPAGLDDTRPMVLLRRAHDQQVSRPDRESNFFGGAYPHPFIRVAKAWRPPRHHRSVAGEKLG